MDNRKPQGWSQWFSKTDSSVSSRVRQQEEKVLQSNPTLLKRQPEMKSHPYSSNLLWKLYDNIDHRGETSLESYAQSFARDFKANQHKSLIQCNQAVVNGEKEKKEALSDLVQRMWGLREGTVTRWWPRQQKWRSQKGKLVERGRRVVWSGEVEFEGLPVGLPSEKNQQTAQTSHWEQSRTLGLQMGTGHQWQGIVPQG